MSVDLSTAIENEIRGDMRNIAAAHMEAAIPVDALVKAATSGAFLSDLQKSDYRASSVSRDLFMAHMSVDARIFGRQSPYNAIAAMLVPVSEASQMIQAIQKSRQKPYHKPGTLTECGKTADDWTTRGVVYESIFGIGGGPKMRDIKNVGDAYLQRPPTKRNSPLEQCGEDAWKASTQTYTVWTLSNDTVDFHGESYRVLIGAIGSSSDKAVVREKMLLGDKRKYLGTLLDAWVNRPDFASDEE